MRMCTGKHSRRQLVRIQCRPPPGTRDPGSESPSFFLSDSRERPARRLKAPAVIRRNWVGPGYNLGPEDGSIPSCASNDCRSRAFIYLDSRERPARRTPDCPAVICSIDVMAASQPSKLIVPVRVRYTAPAGRIRPFLSLFSLQNPFADSWQRPPSGLAMFPEVIRRSR